MFEKPNQTPCVFDPLNALIKTYALLHSVVL